MRIFTTALVASILVYFFSSCAMTQAYYQISQAKPMDESIVKSNNDDNGYYYQDQNCRISYDFWEVNGDGGFVVTNLTDQVLYIIKDKCFFIKNGVSYDYFHNNEWVGSSDSDKGSKHTHEKNVIGIAPHTSRSIREYNIYPYVYLDCDLDRKPGANHPATMAFTPANSPVRFGNFITYKVGDDGQEQEVRNMFYTSRVTNYRKSDLQFSRLEEYCPNISDVRREIVSYLRFAPTTGYYVTYTK